MPVVVVEIVSEAPSVSMARAMLEACSASVREGKCELSTEAASEPHLADATVSWSDSTEHAVRIAVQGVRGGVPGVHQRVLRFKDTDVRVERWRAVGLTIATLVGDALPPSSSASGEAHFDDTGAAPGGHATTQPTQAVPPASTTQEGTAPPVVAVAPPASVGDKRLQDRVAPTPAAPSEPLRHTLWAGLTGALGPGLEQGSLRLGAWVDASFRPTAFPVFGRIGLGYAGRVTNPGGLSVQWETATLGAGAVLGGERLHFEPRLAIGLENVHAAATDSASGRSDSGNKLGASLHLGFDGVWQFAGLGLVATFEGWQAHAPTRIVVQNHEVGISAGTNWAIGLGARYYIL